MQHKTMNNIIHKLQTSIQVFCVALSIIFTGVLCIPESTYAATLAKPANNLGLVSYWSFDDASGTVATDFSGNGKNGTALNLSNPATATSGWGAGKLGGGINFDATKFDGVYVSNATPLGSVFTFSMWVKPSSLSTNQVFAGTYSSNGWLLRNSAFTNKRLEFYNGATNYTSSNTTLTTGVWQLITVTYDGSYYKFYYNGALDYTSSPGQGAPNSESTLYISRLFGGYGVSGAIDEVRQYSRALSATEITSLYNAGAQKLKTGVSNNGLVGYWSFDDASGTVATDFSGNGNTGTLTNIAAPATATSGWGTGKLGGGINFDGINDYVDTGDNIALNFGTGDFTVSAWVYNTSQNTRDTIVGKDSSTGGRQFSLQLNSNSVGGVVAGEIIAAVFSANTPTYAGVVSSAGAVSPNAWHHIVFRRLSGTLYLYLDGVSLSVTTSGNTAASLSVQDTTGPMQIGARQYTGSQDYFAGKIDEVRIYNRALSATEIANLYTAGAQKINASRNVTGSSLDSGLVGLWSFDGKDLNGTTAFDRSGQGNNGTLTNGPVPVIGKMGQALQFNESNTYINVPDSVSLQVTSTFTLSAWVYFTGNSANLDTIFMKNLSNSNYYGMYVTGYRAWFYNPSITIATNLNTVPSNTWVHVVLTFDSTLPSNNAKMYLNGAFDNAVNKTTAFGSSAGGSMSIGRDPINGRYFGGKIDDVRIYNRALSSDEVKLLYNFGK